MHQLMGITLLLLTVCAEDDVTLHLGDMVRDVTHYLRSHKFNEYDRRYHKEPTQGDYFAAFPRPPLRSLHWEVQLHCEPSFKHCIEYLHKKVRMTDFQRTDDTAVVIAEQNWTFEANMDQINSVDVECISLKEKDEKDANPFEGPLERFKWRTTASYFLCWYTMKESPSLKKVDGRCDNFADCSHSNSDARADDADAFACAAYSVCPDPCCPMRHLSTRAECWNSELNPCFLHNSNEQRSCLLERGRNTDFTDIVLNRWNITCKCANAGYVWEPRFGTCVDVNECAIGNHTCRQAGELCLNLPGSFRCVCNWGFVWNAEKSRCVESGTAQINKGSIRLKNKKLGRAIALFLKPYFQKWFSSSSHKFTNSNIMLTVATFLRIYMTH